MQSDKKVVLYIGVGLDGYIAAKGDNLDWLLNTSGDGDNGFGNFYATGGHDYYGEKNIRMDSQT